MLDSMLEQSFEAGNTATSKDVWDEVAQQSSQDPGLLVCVMIRNEEHLLDEWIAFHWLQGVRKFVVYDDGSTDASPQILHKYVQYGIVDYRRVKDDSSQKRGDVTFQMGHLNACIEEAWSNRESSRIDWVLLSDVDEFSYAKDSNMTLVQAIHHYYKGQPCVNIFRKDFGSSFRLRRPKTGLVIENYVLSAPTYRDRAPKKLIIDLHPREKDKAITKVFSPHRTDKRVKDLTCAQDEAHHLQMNQYLRSLEDYDLKIKTHWSREGKYEEDPLGHFWERDKNDVLDDSAPQRFACRVRSLLAFWGNTSDETNKHLQLANTKKGSNSP